MKHGRHKLGAASTDRPRPSRPPATAPASNINAGGGPFDRRFQGSERHPKASPSWTQRMGKAFAIAPHPQATPETRDRFRARSGTKITFLVAVDEPCRRCARPTGISLATMTLQMRETSETTPSTPPRRRRRTARVAAHTTMVQDRALLATPPIPPFAPHRAAGAEGARCQRS